MQIYVRWISCDLPEIVHCLGWQFNDPCGMMFTMQHMLSDAVLFVTAMIIRGVWMTSGK